MLKKPLAIAAIAAGVTFAPAHAFAGDAGLGALFGATLGAAIGHGMDGRHGAVVGGVLGAVAGARIASDSRSFRGPAPVYYPPAPIHYAPPRIRYQRARVYYAPPPRIVRHHRVNVHGHGPLRPVYVPVAGSWRPDAHPHPHLHRADRDRHWR